MRNAALSLSTVAALAVLLAGCDSTPTEPSRSVAHPTTVPPTGNIAGTWKGTLGYPFLHDCEGSVSFAQATFEQNGSAVRGTLSAPAALCFPLEARAFTGTIEGNVLVGSIGTFGSVQGVLRGETLEIGLGINSGGWASEGVLYLHR
jgi:hypothetical protein